MSPLSKASSAHPAAWIVEGLNGFALDVGSFVPAVFGAYAASVPSGRVRIP